MIMLADGVTWWRSLWLGALAFLVCGSIGCLQPRNAPDIVCVPVLIPRNMMAGGFWDFEPVSQEEANEFLATMLPAGDEVPANITNIEVLEKYCGKCVVWIPPEIRPKKDGPPYQRDYREWLSGEKPDLGFPSRRTVGTIVRTYITSITPGFGKEDVVLVAVITRRNLLILAVPRDYTKDSLPPIPDLKRVE